MALPVTVVTGFLGSGKTTLLNRLLSEPHGKRYAVVVNELGELGIDNDLIVGADEEVFEMNNGCLCCTVRGDLIRILQGLLKRRRHLDGILIETTGIADPAPVAQTFFFDDDIAAKTRLDGVVAVVDAGHLETQLAERAEAADQIAFADRVVLNKVDQVDGPTERRLQDRLRALNPFAALRSTQYGDVPAAELLDVGAFDLDRVQQQNPHFLEDHHHHHHADAVGSVSLAAEAPLDGERFMAWLEQLVAERGQDLLRYKGVLNFAGSFRRFVLQGVHMQMQGDFGARWETGESRQSRLVLIGRNLDAAELQAAFARTVARSASPA